MPRREVEGDVEERVVIGLQLGRHDVELVVAQDPEGIEEVVVHEIPVRVLAAVECDHAVDEGEGDQRRQRQPPRPPVPRRLTAPAGAAGSLCFAAKQGRGTPMASAVGGALAGNRSHSPAAKPALTGAMSRLAHDQRLPQSKGSARQRDNRPPSGSRVWHTEAVGLRARPATACRAQDLRGRDRGR